MACTKKISRISVITNSEGTLAHSAFLGTIFIFCTV
jgi:hypothetical protein